jgi:small subunit ribosomal protein S1
MYNKKKNSNEEIFDWKMYESGLTKEEQEERKKIGKFYTEFLPNIQELEIYKGCITKIMDRNVIIDIGFKSEGIIQINELRDIPNVKVGSVIEVMLVKRDYKGQCILSYKKAKKFRSWERIKNAYNKQKILKGYVTARTKGGFIMILEDYISSFLPGSHTDINLVKDYDFYVGKTMEVKILKINNKTKNIVVSHKVLIEKDIEKQKKKLISKLEEGQVLEGKVKNIINYGGFVDLGGIDGLIHITDISWKRIEHPSEKIKIGKKYNFVVLGIDKKKNRVQLGLKQLQPHPWSLLKNEIKVGAKVKGKITVVTDYGAFVEIIPGIEGLIHISEISWSNKFRSAKELIKVGQKINCIIITMDNKERKISLSIKRVTNDPWSKIEKKYPIGSTNIGKIKTFLNFGFRIELENGIEGVISFDNLSWDKNIKKFIDIYKIGQEIELVILNYDTFLRKILLGRKQII